MKNLSKSGMSFQSTTKTDSIARVIAVVGGGASGMAAACFAAGAVLPTRGDKIKVVMFEKTNHTGKKLSITGKGRCNLTNNCSPGVFIENVVSNPRFLQSAIHMFPPSFVMEYFESLGVKLKTERGRRVFPASDKSLDVVRALRLNLAELGVKTVFGRVSGVSPSEGGYEVVYEESGKKRKLKASAVILATGGITYPLTGSDGDGYKIAASLGHKVIKPALSLVPLNTAEDWPKRLAGLTLKNVAVSFYCGGRLCFSGMGELLFTHFGVSGPLVLTASAYIKSYPAEIFIDMKPALDSQTLDRRLLDDFSSQKNRVFSNSLDGLLPKTMIPEVVCLSGIDGQKQVNSITKAERSRLAALLKKIPVHAVSTRGEGEAVITKGGVDVREVSPATMESKLHKGLFFAGELLDVDCLTGGYNLQAAFSTGFAAGRASAETVCRDTQKNKNEIF